MKEGIKNAVEKYGKILFLAILGAVVVNILLPIHWRFFFAIVVFLVVLNTILEVLEKDNATKRLTKKLLLFGTGLVAFVGLRIAADYLFNMPIIDSFNDLGKVKGITGMAYQGATQALILELMFLLPGIGIAYGLVKGGSKTKGMIYIMSCLMFFVVLWQVKQVEHSKAMKHYAQATIDKQATDLCQAALKKDVNAALTIAVATENINDSIFAGARMAIKGKQITQVGMEPMIEVVLEENGVFNGIEIFVPYRKLRILEKTPTPSTPAQRAATNTNASKIYHSGTYYFSLKAGEQTPYWIGFSGVGSCVLGSVDDQFKLLYSNGEIVPAWTPGNWPDIKGHWVKIIAVTDQPEIKMVVN